MFISFPAKYLKNEKEKKEKRKKEKRKKERTLTLTKH